MAMTPYTDGVVHYIQFVVSLYNCVPKDQVAAFEQALDVWIREYFPSVDHHNDIIIELGEHTGTVDTCEGCKKT